MIYLSQQKFIYFLIVLVFFMLSSGCALYDALSSDSPSDPTPNDASTSDAATPTDAAEPRPDSEPPGSDGSSIAEDVTEDILVDTASDIVDDGQNTEDISRPDSTGDDISQNDGNDVCEWSPVNYSGLAPNIYILVDVKQKSDGHARRESIRDSLKTIFARSHPAREARFGLMLYPPSQSVPEQPCDERLGGDEILDMNFHSENSLSVAFDLIEVDEDGSTQYGPILGRALYHIERDELLYQHVGQDYHDELRRKALILFTDGAATGNACPPSNLTGGNYAAAQLTQLMENENVEIFLSGFTEASHNNASSGFETLSDVVSTPGSEQMYNEPREINSRLTSIFNQMQGCVYTSGDDLPENKDELRIKVDGELVDDFEYYPRQGARLATVKLGEDACKALKNISPQGQGFDILEIEQKPCEE